MRIYRVEVETRKNCVLLYKLNWETHLNDSLIKQISLTHKMMKKID